MKRIRRRPLCRFVQACRYEARKRGMPDAKLAELLWDRRGARIMWWRSHTGFQPTRALVVAASQALKEGTV